MIVIRRFQLIALALLPLVALVLTPPGAAHADTLDALVQKLSGGGFSARAKVVDELAATGDERVSAVLEALQGGDLFTRKSDKRVFITRSAGDELALVDPVTGQQAGTAPKSALIEPKPDSAAAYDKGLQARLGKRVWAADCGAWYVDANGRNYTLYPDNVREFLKEMKTPDLGEYAVARQSP